MGYVWHFLIRLQQVDTACSWMDCDYPLWYIQTLFSHWSLRRWHDIGLFVCV
jgi:hypothetical protein